MQDEQSKNLFRTRLMIPYGFERPFLEAVSEYNDGYRFYSEEIAKMKKGFTIDNGIILFGLGKDADVNNNRISPEKIILPEDLKKPEFSDYPVLISSDNYSVRKSGETMKTVITYGTFDLLHYGHINLYHSSDHLWKEKEGRQIGRPLVSEWT